MKKYSFGSVIFDLDGVITKTARLHAAAWKSVFDEYLYLREKRNKEAFREFTHQADYLPCVDGKPRYKGVKSFLESRRINIPYGELSDRPDKETVCGLGNKKNLVFRALLKKEGGEIYPSSIQLIKALKKAGIKVGVASSSKNCKLILESVGREDLFETRVDGEVSVELKLKGKPEGDIFVTAARNLGTEPGESVVIEDAVSGVQAGRNGAFRLVVGVARKDNESELLENGADVVVKDLKEIDMEWIERWFQRKPLPFFQSWEAGKEISVKRGDKRSEGKIFVNSCYSRSAKEAIFNGKKLVFFLDYDGTLSPIADRPALARIAPDMKEALKKLSEKHITAIISGRPREEVENLVALKELLYAGAHGFDISLPGASMIQGEAQAFVPLISEITEVISKELGQIPNILIENKKFSLAVHYRLVDKKHLAKIKEIIDKIIYTHKKVRLLSGKKVFELMPDIDWDKGKAVRWIIETLKISWNEASIVYIGDDTTDENVFRSICTRGTGILVSSQVKVSAAHFWLSSTEEVKRLFEEVISRT